MTMNPIFPQREHASTAAPPAASTVPASRSRLDRLACLGPDDKTAGLAWLAVHCPAVCDAMLDALDDDEEELACQEPEPYCATCGADVGIFLGSGPDWRHYRGRGTPASPAELFDPGHAPAVAWRTPRLTTAR
jgi:hypothetical protein